MPTVELTQEQFEALQNGEAVTIQPPKLKPKKWNPEGGSWFITSSGEIHNCGSSSETREFGMEYQTKEQAEEARDAMRVHNRLLAYVAEFDPDFVADWSNHSQHKWYVFSHYLGVWRHSSVTVSEVLGVVYMSHQCAKGLIAKLNSGEVVL